MNKIRTLGAIVLLAASASFAQAREGQAVAAPASAASPEAITRSFYGWYLRALNDGQDPIGKKAEMGRYVTRRLITQLTKMMNSPDGLDYDYFLSAQDYDASWEKNMSISKPTIRQAAATVNVTFKWDASTVIRLRVTLKQESQAWKIDRVQRL
jgi:hypothetical protein